MSSRSKSVCQLLFYNKTSLRQWMLSASVFCRPIVGCSFNAVSGRILATLFISPDNQCNHLYHTLNHQSMQSLVHTQHSSSSPTTSAITISIILSTIYVMFFIVTYCLWPHVFMTTRIFISINISVSNSYNLYIRIDTNKCTYKHHKCADRR